MSRAQNSRQRGNLNLSNMGIANGAKVGLQLRLPQAIPAAALPQLCHQGRPNRSYSLPQ